MKNPKLLKHNAPNYFFRNKRHLSLLSALEAASWFVDFTIPVNGWIILTLFRLAFSIYQDNRLTPPLDWATTIIFAPLFFEGQLISTKDNAFSFLHTKQFLIITSVISGVFLSYFTFAKILPESTYFQLLNNAAVNGIARMYNEKREAFMREISGATIVLATVIFLSFGLIAFYSR